MARRALRHHAERARGGDASRLRRRRRVAHALQLDVPPAARGLAGAGTVHHVAWGTTMAEHPLWLDRLRAHNVHSTGIVDRHYFHSIYYREPNGVLFELADDGPGFTVDSPVEELGSRIILPPQFESHRAESEKNLTPLPDPRADWPRKVR